MLERPAFSGNSEFQQLDLVELQVELLDAVWKHDHSVCVVLTLGFLSEYQQHLDDLHQW